MAEYQGLAEPQRYRAEYFHQDHLGNTRLVFSDFNQNGLIELTEEDPTTQINELEITQEAHYYPFGMGHLGPWYETVAPENKYLYNGKELSEDYEIDLMDYGARWYDGAIGRFTTTDRFAEKYYPLSPYGYAAGNPVKFVDVNGDSIKLNFIGDFSQHAKNKFSGIINNALEGQFRVAYRNVTYDKDNEVASGPMVILPMKGGGDLSKMSLHGQEFHRELTELAHGEGNVEINVDYARSDIHTGNFGKETIDIADVLQFNENLSELGGTQAGKIIHEFREQYGKQVLGGQFRSAHAAGIQAENNVNRSIRREGGSDRSSATQIFSGPGGTVKNKIIFENRRVIKVLKQ